ncbi:MAG: prolyl oligopeptidase family serine peptidase [Halanaerobiales bacterium]|nr:prolyl oligopeptidase family serine peptidase [Halanaerobiales bacterium]
MLCRLRNLFLITFLMIFLCSFSILAEVFTEVNLKTLDDVQIAGNYYSKGHKSLIILLNGLTQTKNEVAKFTICQKLLMDFDVLNIDYRGKGNSVGEFTGGNKEIFDIQAAVNFAKSQGYNKIGILGVGFGGYMSIKGASLIPEIDSIASIGAPYVIDQSFKETNNQLSDNPAMQFGQYILKQLIGVRGSKKLPEEVYPLKPYLENLSQPLLIVHGKLDTVVSYNDASFIYENASGKKRLLLLENGSNAEALSEEDMANALRRIIEWFNSTLIQL